jgi:hypothetical protein
LAYLLLVDRGLAKLGYRWPDLTKSLQQSLYSSFVRLQAEFNPRDMSILLWSFAELEAALDMAPDYFLQPLLQRLEKNLEKMKGADVSRCIWGLSGTSITWNMLPDSTRWGLNIALRRVGAQMNPQEVANCAYGLALTCFDTHNPADVAFRGAHEAMLSIIRSRPQYQLKSEGQAQLRDDVRNKVFASTSNSESMIEVNAEEVVGGYDEANSKSFMLRVKELVQLRIFAHYLQATQYVTDTKRIPRMLLQAHDSSYYDSPMNNSLIMSKLQQRVVKGLKDALLLIPEGSDFVIKGEQSSFDGVFPIDAAVFKRGEVLALLEVDGPHHYRYDNKLRRSDMLKEYMYRQRHPGVLFHRIRYDEENKVGAEVLGVELVTLLSKCAKQSEDYWGNFWRNAAKKMGDFFSWGLRNDFSPK